MRSRGPHRGLNGMYGGSGSRPAPRSWTPGVKSRDEAPPDPVRPDLKRVRLRRGPRRETPTPTSAWIALTAVGASILFLLVCIWRA